MQISSISNSNFGKIYWDNTTVQAGVNLSPHDKNVIKDIITALNRDVAQNISAYVEIGRPQVMRGRKSIRVTTSPTSADMAVIKAFRPNAERRDYKRRSYWFRLYDKYSYDELADFIAGQKGFIHHCTIDPRHNAKPFDRPMWQADAGNKKNYGKRRFFAEV